MNLHIYIYGHKVAKDPGESQATFYWLLTVCAGLHCRVLAAMASKLWRALLCVCVGVHVLMCIGAVAVPMRRYAQCGTIVFFLRAHVLRACICCCKLLLTWVRAYHVHLCASCYVRICASG